MKPVYQTRFGKPDGNCMEACVASILEVGLGDVPDLSAAEDDEWRDVLADYLAEFDLEQMDVLVPQAQEAGVIPTGFHIISGPSPRGDFDHAVVGLGGRMVHDPHPDQVGLAKEEIWTVFIRRFLKQGGPR